MHAGSGNQVSPGEKKFHPLRVNHEDQTKHMSEQFGENQNEKFDKNDFA